MKRIELILHTLKELTEHNNIGVSASEIAEKLNLNRANVSNDLNKLVIQGKATKRKGKPTVFLFVREENINITSNQSVIDKFSEDNPSLYSAVEQAKAAILYPPNGMNILLLGETGVGKSTFAGLINKYVKNNSYEEVKPFITFNCADYANTPQLLLGQLFGVKKGAYTGAECDKSGLLEKADGGILFLDEVHRLPAEGQEMFFIFIDKGVYRRLGETDSERHANVLIIAATTEDPNTSLLKTFTRRIPMTIKIPSLKDRAMEERFNLIKLFMRQESKRLKRHIKVSINSIKALLSYNCEGNVGQLKSDIQLACAKAYADFLSKRKNDIKINSLDLAPYIREGLYKETEHRQLWNKLIDINKRYCIFNEKEEGIIFEENKNNESIYEMLDLRMAELKGMGFNGIEIEEEVQRDIDEYFKKYINRVDEKIDTTNIKNLIDKPIMDVIERVIYFCEDALEKNIDKKIYYGLSIHMNNSIDRVRRNKKIVNPNLRCIRENYKKEFEVALECLKIIEKSIDITMPIDEAGFIAMFLSYDYEIFKVKRKYVSVIIVAHGVSMATSMADTVNGLLGTKYAVGINAPIEEKPQKILEKIKEYIIENDIKSDILFLVDMGSLTTFGKEIEEEFNFNTRIIPLVSTLHALEATRKSMLGYSLEEVYRETLEVNNLYDNDIVEAEDYKGTNEERKQIIVTLCTTGMGGARLIKEILDKKLNYDKKLIEIVPINYVGEEDIYKRIDNLKKNYEIICFISSFELDVNYPQFEFSDVLDGKCIKEIQNIIDIERTYIKMGDTLENQLKNINGKTVLNDIKKFNKTIVDGTKSNVNTNVLIGITFHVACMIERIKYENIYETFNNKEQYIEEHIELYRIIKNACMPLNTKYCINISDDEICYLMNFFFKNNLKRTTIYKNK